MPPIHPPTHPCVRASPDDSDGHSYPGEIEGRETAAVGAIEEEEWSIEQKLSQTEHYRTKY